MQELGLTSTCTARAAEATADTRAAEAQVDALVSACYGLTPAEAAAVRRPEAGS